MGLDPLDLDTLQVTGGRDAAGHLLQHVVDARLSLQLKDGGALDVAGDGHHRADGGDKNGIARFEAEVARTIPTEEKVVEVQGPDRTVAADQLQIPQ
jgi:hypothetical protein